MSIEITGGISTTITQIINVNDIPEKPTIADDTFSVTENTAANVIIKNMNDYYSDPDAGESVSFSILAGNVNTVWSVDSATRTFNTFKNQLQNHDNNRRPNSNSNKEKHTRHTSFDVRTFYLKAS